MDFYFLPCETGDINADSMQLLVDLDKVVSVRAVSDSPSPHALWLVISLDNGKKIEGAVDIDTWEDLKNVFLNYKSNVGDASWQREL